jgi:signal transduction histidine kinase
MEINNFAKEYGDTLETTFRKSLTLIIASILCACGAIWAVIYYFIFGWGLIAFLPFSFLIIVGIAIPVSHFLHNHRILLYTFLICITWITALIQWSIGSLNQSGFVVFWSFLGPIGATIFLSRKQAILFLLMFITIIVISAVYEPALLGYEVIVSGSIRTMFHIMNIGMASSVVFATSLWFVNAIQKEKNHSQELLVSEQAAFKKLEETQEQLIKSEKMAAFGMVATRVAHEIQNPLNFVNNFSFLSGELVDDIISSPSDEEKKESGELLKINLSKIIDNGNRASLIIKQLLEHSNRGTTQEYFEK